jgi:hypothetical protein
VRLALSCLLLWGLSYLLTAAGDATRSPDASGTTTDWSNCLACHTVAGGELPKLADIRPDGLGTHLPTSCYACHPDAALLKPVSDWRHPVQPVALHLACTSCHVSVAHSAQQPPPRPTGDYNSAGCYSCHASVRAERRMQYGHTEMRSLRCCDCHPAHTPLRAALPAQFVPQPVRPYWLGAYDWERSNADCLACHPAMLLTMDLRQGFVTLNTENYHALHVQQARVLCIECHAAHGSYIPAMLRPVLLTGEALSYAPRSNGGSCSATCHEVSHNGWQYANRAY